MSRIKNEQIKRGRYQNFVVKFYWLVIFLIFLAAVCVEYFVIIKPKLQQTFNGGPLDVESRQAILEEQRTYYDALKALEKEAGEINQVELEKVNYVIARKVDIPDILKQIYLLSEKKNMEFLNFNYSSGNGILQIELFFNGTNYQNIKEYLGELEKNIRIMDVTNISLAGIGENFSLKIQSYYLE